MATERLVLEITEKGARVVSGNIEGVAKSSKKADKASQGLKRTLGALGIGLLVRELVQLTDTYTSITNRTRLVTENSAQLGNVLGELRNISNRTRSSFEGTAELFNRVAISAKDLGRSNEEVLQLTEGLNQAIILSGASATEANAALIQLSQGLAAGALRGEELNSVLEQTPLVADIIAKELGVLRGELKDVAAEGKITADVVFDAFEAQRETLEEQFATTVPTLSQAFQVVRNELLFFTGEANNASGAAEGLARSIITLTEVIPDAAGGLADLAIQAGIFARFTIDALLADSQEEAERIKRIRDDIIAAGSAFDTGARVAGTGGATAADEGFGGAAGGGRQIVETSERVLELIAIVENADKKLRDSEFKKLISGDVEIERRPTGAEGALGPPILELEEFTNVAVESLSVIDEAGSAVFGNLDRTISSVLLNGERGFARFAASALQSLAQIGLRSALSAIPGFSPGGGGLFGGQGLVSRQFGGPFAAGQPVLVGERGPEVVNFGQRGRVEPVQTAAAPPVNIVNVTDPNEIQAVIASGAADDAIVNRLARNPDIVRSAIGTGDEV